LIERARLGPYKKLIGTDLDEKALAAAARNFMAGGIADIDIEKIDARHAHPEGVTLILTNPPMGRRVHPGPSAADKGTTLAHLLTSFLMHAGRIVAPAGGWFGSRPFRAKPIQP